MGARDQSGRRDSAGIIIVAGISMLVHCDIVCHQVVLWDTADMEKNSINSMTKSYFIECVGVMMVYKKGDLGSLIKLDAWWTRANESQFCRSLVFSLWCNDIDRSEDETEVSEEHVRQYAAKWKVPCDLVFNIDPGEDDRESVTVKYKKLVKAVREKSQGTALLRSTTAGRVRLPDVTRRANIQEKPKKTCSSPCNR